VIFPQARAEAADILHRDISEEIAMTKPSRPHREAAKRRSLFPQRVQIVSHLGEASDDRFYTGFTGDIGEGGLFVASYDLRQIGTPAEVEIHFPNGGITFARGFVEWVRELNARSPEIPPGMGISLHGLTPLALRSIGECLAVREPLFWDGSDAVPPISPVTDDIAEIPVPAPDAFSPDLAGEARFAEGLFRDVQAMIANGPTVLFDRNVEEEKLCAPARRSAVALHVCVSQKKESGQFHGGFTDGDGAHRLFVETRAALALGERVSLRIRGSSGIAVSAVGEVLWARRSNPLLPSCVAPPGFGIRVDDMRPALWGAIGGTTGGVLSCEESADA